MKRIYLLELGEDLWTLDRWRMFVRFPCTPSHKLAPANPCTCQLRYRARACAHLLTPVPPTHLSPNILCARLRLGAVARLVSGHGRMTIVFCCSGICKATTMKIGDEEFCIRLYVLALKGYELVLGIQWLRTLGPVLWDFERLSMSFWRDDHRVQWIDVDAPLGPRLHVLRSDDLNYLLVKFSDIFEASQDLPPRRRFDHHIHLLPRTTPMAIRPYRYLQMLKEEIERQCEDLLRQGIIRESTLVFSSPVLFVRKQDNSWHFCVNYRALNAKTVKDKFPIPVIDELLDELKDARFFTKLDLCSGYHHVLMHPLDVEKTVFRTHHGH
ncbi:uncharacterized protein LOC133887650 [Phragmites australis]|uniref:uncharacterized protein LOC133887650 n=1 Tax=Phragmites australis TaxID=29695 RepID=UPI002D774A61|nr:uncharacterized protein LOC133887650 [Phragmites australis]XP_062183584.1 uncharacterized protein LOC133887650 [Phragmites australis]